MSNLAPKPPLLGLPANMTLVDIMKKNGITPKTEPKTEAQILSVRAKVALSAQQIRNTTNIPNPRDDSIKLNADTEIDNSFAVLPIDSIQFYEHNPRIASNEAFPELKENIRVNNIQSPLSVTKRPGANHYILYAGGNTRLLAIKELFAETGDPKFETTRVIIKAWRGEVAVMLAHMAENTNRSDMTFWDKANGILEIKKQMETDLGRELVLRDFEQALLKEGIQVNRSSLSWFIYANEKLSPIGPYLTGLAVRTIQPKINALIRLCGLFNISEDDFSTNILTGILNDTAEYLREAKQASVGVAEKNETSLSVERFIEDVENAVCAQCVITLRDLKKMLGALDHDPKLSLEELRAAIVTPTKPDKMLSNYRQSGVTAPVVHPPVASSEQPAEVEITPEEPTTQTVWTGLEVTNASDSDMAVMQQATQDDFIQEQIAQEQASHTNLDKLKNIIQKLISEAQLGACFVEIDSMPLGYYMQFDKSGPLDLRENATDAQSVWWLLALSSGQYDPDLCRAALPENCEWRQLTEDRHPQYSVLGSIDIAVQNNIGGAGAYLQAPWLLDWENKVSELSLEFILALKLVETQGRSAC